MNNSLSVTDCELIAQVKEGNRSAFDILVTRYKQKAFSLAFNIVGNSEDAKDIAQDAFINVYKNISGFRQESSFFT